MSSTENLIETQERRQFARISFFSQVQLYSGTKAWSCEIIDVSLKGVSFTKPDDWNGKSGLVYRLSMSLCNSPSISMNIKIVHISENILGAKWNKIDVGSFSRLKRLLELNCLERNRISKEISYL